MFKLQRISKSLCNFNSQKQKLDLTKIANEALEKARAAKQSGKSAQHYRDAVKVTERENFSDEAKQLAEKALARMQENNAAGTSANKNQASEKKVSDKVAAA